MLTPNEKGAKIEAVTGRLDDEMEVTPEMIRAGVLLLLEYDPRFGDERDIVEDIFRTMLSMRNSRKQSPDPNRRIDTSGRLS
jgi:hypothetical protein